MKPVVKRGGVEGFCQRSYCFEDSLLALVQGAHLSRAVVY
jgi:hypothetical protein